jgi:lipoprotein NlpI
MRHSICFGLLVTLAIAGGFPRFGRAETVEDLLKQARAALAKGQNEDALTLAGKAIALDPKNAQAYLFRGAIYEALQRHTEAVADFDKTIALAPNNAEAYNRRGSEHFKLGHIAESIKDFDKFLELKPAEEPRHWQRGISYYYAGRFEEGRKQFEGYERIDKNDVENAVWRYLCMARVVGVEKARAALLKVGNDKRVPMMQIYALFSGQAKPADVLAAAEAGQPSAAERNQRLFYAHLYLGLYYEAAGDEKQALEHIAQAAEKYKVGHYMWDVARVHRDLLLKEAKKK